jgi:hypothetical protein
MNRVSITIQALYRYRLLNVYVLYNQHTLVSSQAKYSFIVHQDAASSYHWQWTDKVDNFFPIDKDILSQTHHLTTNEKYTISRVPLGGYSSVWGVGLL